MYADVVAVAAVAVAAALVGGLDGGDGPGGGGKDGGAVWGGEVHARVVGAVGVRAEGLREVGADGKRVAEAVGGDCPRQRRGVGAWGARAGRLRDCFCGEGRGEAFDGGDVGGGFAVVGDAAAGQDGAGSGPFPIL